MSIRAWAKRGGMNRSAAVRLLLELGLREASKNGLRTSTEQKKNVRSRQPEPVSDILIRPASPSTRDEAALDQVKRASGGSS
jgi:hypothetical protein